MCTSGSKFPPFKDTSHIGLGPTLMTSSTLNQLHLQWPCFQRRSCSVELGVRTSTYGFWGGWEGYNSTHHTTLPLGPWDSGWILLNHIFSICGIAGLLRFFPAPKLSDSKRLEHVMVYFIPFLNGFRASNSFRWMSFLKALYLGFKKLIMLICMGDTQYI